MLKLLLWALTDSMRRRELTAYLCLLRGAYLTEPSALLRLRQRLIDYSATELERLKAKRALLG